MAFIGLGITFLGFVIAVLSLGMASSTGVRMGMVLAGIVVSLVGICKFVNGAYLKDAIWKK